MPQSPQTIHAATAAIGGTDHYYEPPLDIDDLVTIARCAALVRAAGHELPWSPEIQAGIWRLPGQHVDYRDPTDSEQTLLYLAALAFGLKGINFYMLVNRENWELAPLEPGGLPSSTLRAVRTIVRLIERVPELGELKLVSPIALAWHPAYGRDAYAAPAGDSTRAAPHEATVAAFSELVRSGHVPRIWDTEQAPPESVAAVVTATAAYMSHRAEDQLAQLSVRGVPVIVVGDPAVSGIAASIDDIHPLLSANGIEAPVRVGERDGFATLHEGSARQIVFALNARSERRTLSLHFSSNSIAALWPLTDDGPAIPVIDRRARIECGPKAGRVLAVGF